MSSAPLIAPAPLTAEEYARRPDPGERKSRHHYLMK